MWLLTSFEWSEQTFAGIWIVLSIIVILFLFLRVKALQAQLWIAQKSCKTVNERYATVVADRDRVESELKDLKTAHSG